MEKAGSLIRYEYSKVLQLETQSRSFKININAIKLLSPSIYISGHILQKRLKSNGLNSAEDLQLCVNKIIVYYYMV